MSSSDFPPVRAAGRGAAWYRGDCHVHSVHSDGELNPEELAAGARAVELDFIATTEHNSAAKPGAWGHLAADDFLILLGEEVTTKTGHWLALGLAPGEVVDWNHQAGDGLLGQCLDQVHRAGGVCVVAHPRAPYPSGDFMFPFPGFDVVEVWNGLWTSDRPWNADNEAALAEWARGLAADIRKGSWRPAMGNSDTHLEKQIGIPHTVVFAEELSTAAVLAGIRAGRSWIAESADVDGSFTAHVDDRVAGLGERLATHGEQVEVHAAVRGVPTGTVSFHTDRGKVHQASLPDGGVGAVRWNTTADRSAFVRIEVRHTNGHVAALTNPIILD
ncbi:MULTISPECIES: CehA/McbA family metallohydrolase [unclassified Streptomyces]|uniref:CehA/McbA family metallohydrolase n=1 Tax=unclassified Streptomyces TaxID=2593676 RepID=UPI002ED02F69|nr:CehA/McbA family metallohydrolase [Streptomyces sp. NBC_00891]WSY05150.1 CehA/McbA family metallohydrolase [Streptomyces sp. NBC_00890]WSZ06774.1 CehA/McbA family metallohydrolase [Streptomyces sp. NBC_00869]WSZ25727.1 CehA/McbA family metallohydrolase [Streptomyces sp. NBC_00870]